MMYPRLKLARNLLNDDGVIFISIDDNEVDSLRKLCAEVFGEQNFIAQIIWQKVYSPKNSAQWFSEDHDYIVALQRTRAPGIRIGFPALPRWRPDIGIPMATREARGKPVT